jgi:hypothetical protein
MSRVQGVLTKQGTDISSLLNAAADEYADGLTGVLIAESELNELALRTGIWPDYSAGLSQVIAPNLGFGTYQTPPDEVSLALYREYMFQPANAIKEGWRYYKAALERMDYDPLWAALSYNRGPRYSRADLEQQVRDDPAIRRRFDRYRESLERAEEYRMGATVGEGIKNRMNEAGDQPISNEWTEDTGNGKVAKAWGTKGLYIASDDSGAWIAAGPFAGVET